MSLLKLDNVGKIYVSEGNIAVGIRGVNLSFDRGELVAITGESGSGKSTLLNVISGMDTYEEGELLIEGQPTSHYLQPDWEQYRQKYISFIFQDYNIIDSFTVLQNVELALMTIENPKERRARAVELIERVGLSSHMKHKGSQLSGGQKQRTVIARALAKDSPIILADEPTGNLDSKTAQEIIELLREVSRDKLLIIVTHDFDLVENVATRHVRIFDGAVESDRVLAANAKAENAEEDTVAKPEQDATEESAETVIKSKWKNGFLLGKTLFTAKPNLSCFLCFLLVLGLTGLFLITALCGGFTNMFRKFYMFVPNEGRLVLVRQDNAPITDRELSDLAAKHGAKDSLHYDFLMDATAIGGYLGMLTSYSFTGEDVAHEGHLRYVYDHDFGKPDYGRYPQTSSEVFLCLPYYFKDPDYPSGLPIEEIELGGMFFTIVGTKYYVDTRKMPTCSFTRQGLLEATAFVGLATSGNGFTVDMENVLVNGEVYTGNYHYVHVSRAVDPDKVYCDSKELKTLISESDTIELSLQANVSLNNLSRMGGLENLEEKDREGFLKLGKSVFTDQIGTDKRLRLTGDSNVIVVGVNVARALFEKCMEGNYTQVSMFFDSDKEAKKQVDSLRDEGYTAVTTDATYSPDAPTLVELVFEGCALLTVWVAVVIFLVFFIKLCSHRSVDAFKGDMAILRSMGIPVQVIKIGMYVRMGLAMIPALVLLPILAYLVYHVRILDEVLHFLSPIHYILIVLGLAYITWRVTRKQVRNLFGASVKASLRGGEKA